MPTKLSRLLALVTLMPALSNGQVIFDWIDFKEWRQVDEGVTRYLGGSTNAFLTDGSWVIAGCAGQPSPFIITPNITCPLGTTGFIAQGDVDGDGQNDQGSFWSVASLTPAQIVEPFRPELVRITAAPPSGIADELRSSGGEIGGVFNVFDFSVVIWYNVLAPPVDDYEMTGLGMTRPYGPGNSELQRHYKDVPWGTYDFTFPALGDPIRPVPFRVNHLVAPDVYPGRAALKQGWRLRNTDWYQGALEFDPREFYRFFWEGIDFSNTVPSDQLFMQMRAHQYISTDGFTRVEDPPEFFVEGKVQSISCNIITSDRPLDEILTPGSTYALVIEDGDLAGTVQYPITEWGEAAGLKPNELLTIDDLSGGEVSGVITSYCADAFSNPLGEDELRAGLKTDRDLVACLAPGQSYELEITSGSARGTIVFPVTRWGEGTDPGALCNDEFLSQPDENGLVFPRFDSAVYRGNNSTDVGYSYPFDVPESDIRVFINGVETDAFTYNKGDIFTDDPVPTSSTLVAARDYAVQYPGNESTKVGYPITFQANYNDVEVFIDGEFTTMFSISNDEVFTDMAVPATSTVRIANGAVGSEFSGIDPGDSFILRPRALTTTSRVMNLAGNFIMGDLDLSSVVPGGKYVIEMLTGAQAGKTYSIARFGFPSQFWFETTNDLSNKIDIGDTFEFREERQSPTALKKGDNFLITQTFADWVDDKFMEDAIVTVPELGLYSIYLEYDPILRPIPASILASLSTADGNFALAREDVIVFPPYPIETPATDRDRFLLGVYDGFYELGPFFFRPGDSVNSRLDWVRALLSGVVFDNGLRRLNYAVDFIDTYRGFAQAGGFSGTEGGFPFGATNSERKPNFDYDRDGASNLLEFAMQTDVADPLSSPEFQFALGDGPGECMATLTKRPAVGSKLNYFFEYSTNLVDWTTIRNDDPNFEIVEDNEEVLTVSNIGRLNLAEYPGNESVDNGYRITFDYVSQFDVRVSLDGVPVPNLLVDPAADPGFLIDGRDVFIGSNVDDGNGGTVFEALPVPSTSTVTIDTEGPPSSCFLRIRVTSGGN